jgi:hypothetical protein
MTPAEHNEETTIYPLHRPFVERIEECVQRFRARRRLNPAQSDLFSRYLFIGGIDSTQRQFCGVRNLDDDAFEGTTKAEMREITADDVIPRGLAQSGNPRFFNPNFPEHWDVDFAGVAAGFL